MTLSIYSAYFFANVPRKDNVSISRRILDESAVGYGRFSRSWPPCLLIAEVRVRFYKTFTKNTFTCFTLKIFSQIRVYCTKQVPELIRNLE